MPKIAHLSPRQASLFKRPIPQMPEGYYSSGPNPNLRHFVDEHAKHYDPETETYDALPFYQQINIENRRDPINDLHIYWSKKPYGAISQYIRHYTQPGDLVMDPFCGSGGTALAALMEGRAAIAIDLSPAATFITKNYCTPVDVDELQRAFEQLTARVKPEMDWLYETRCDRCNGRATTAYTVYSYVFECGKCGERVPLFDCAEVRVAGKDGKPKTITVCPHCHNRGAGDPETYEISTRSSRRYNPVPVLVSYLCQEGCKPQRGERRHNDKDDKKQGYFQAYDLGKIQEIERKPIPYWYPPDSMMNIEDPSKPWGDKWRAGTSNFHKIAELFTKRNLWALAATYAAIENSNLGKDSLQFCLSGSLYNATKMYKHREAGGGPQSGTYYLPQIFREVAGFTLFYQKVQNLFKASELLLKIHDIPLINISTQSATDIHAVPASSVDYIFTDPPYSGTIQYGELNFLWEAWLRLYTAWHDQEIVVNDTRGKTEFDWAELMRQAMGECYRVLKPGRWISLCYHDSSEGTWQLVQDLMSELGFIPEQAEKASYIDTGQKSYNQLMAEKVTKRDLVINFRKPKPDEIPRMVTLDKVEDKTTFNEKASLVLFETLNDHPGSSTDRLYDELVSRMVRKGQFERHDFDELLRSVAEPVVEPVMKNLFEKETPNLFGTHEVVRWYLKATADVVDEAEGKKEDSAAKHLEAFMVEKWKREKGEGAFSPDEGIHYSDLFEQYLMVKEKPRRLLIDWLPEYFYKTSEGTWRPPKDAEEREQKLALRLSGTLRQIKRFANALADGVPPAERDRPANAATLADWIYQCRRAGLYELGRVLYEKGGLRFEGLGEESRLQVEEDYQICVKRGGKVKSGPLRNKHISSQQDQGF